ncbi:hypothetical protein L6164_017049 [Bauhinia variegata]|uniref:Uncharacterized protein n=1 Tax=Bauhinia variegata TaxID=167791 RepID=A0ACB9N6F5_BAUVA|nr:hypothetical protein L6164_017049 [Bauhinia variegata]
MMRFQRVSPDCQPLRNGNGRKSNMGDTCKDDNGIGVTTSGKILTTASSSNSESKGFRFRSPSRNQENHFRDVPDSPQRTEDSFGHSHSGGGDVLLQWGHRKRSRVSRAEIRPPTEESSSSLQSKPVQRRINHTATTPKLSSASTTMPPPPPTPPPPPHLPSSPTSTNVRGRKDAHRNLDDPSMAATGSESPSRNSHGSNRLVSRSAARKRSPSCLERSDRRIPSSGLQKPSGSSTTQAVDRLNNHVDSASLQSEQEAKGERATSVEVIEWPRIYIALSRKEKEDDFFAMKGTKLPQRPKKRAKNVDRTLQYCFPGMWLSDLTKSRYEVREKKCVKKQKKRGLKGMESLDSESE